MSKRARSTTLLGLVLLLTACGNQSSPVVSPAPEGADAERRLVIIGQPSANARVLPSGVKIDVPRLSGQALPMSELEVYGDAIAVPMTTTDPTSSQLLALQPGDHVISAPTAEAPFGFVREVTSRTTDGGSLVLGTVESTLEESVDNLELDDSYDISMQSLESVEFADGRVFRPTPEDLAPGKPMTAQGTFNIAGINRSFEAVAVTCGDQQVKLSGSIDAQLKGFLNVSIRWFSLRQVEAGVLATEKANLSFDAGCTTSFAKEMHLATLNYGTHVIFVGPVPIVVTPKIELKVGTNGNVTAQSKFAVEQSFSGRYGLGWYRDQGFKGINQTSHSFNHTLNVTGPNSVRGWVGAKGSLTFYGSAQAYGFPKAFLEARATPNSSTGQTDYCLDAGLGVEVGGSLSLFGRTLGSWSRNLGELKRSLICGSTGSTGTGGTGGTGGGTTPPPPPPPPLPGEPCLQGGLKAARLPQEPICEPY